jgi:hypothetical protein
MAFESQAKLCCWQNRSQYVYLLTDRQITRSTFVLVFVMPNGAIRIKYHRSIQRKKFVLTDVKCITKQQYSSDLWKLWPLSLKAKRNCIVDKFLKIIQLIIKNAVRLILDNFGIVGFLFFGRIPVDSSQFSLHFDSIFMLNVLKRSLILAYRPTGGRKMNVAY